MSKLNYGFVSVNTAISIDSMNRLIFGSAYVKNSIVSEIKAYNKAIREAEAVINCNSAITPEAIAVQERKIKNCQETISILQERIQGLNMKRSELLYGVHTKNINKDGILDRLNLASLYDIYTEYRDGLKSRQEYIDTIIATLKTWGMSAPDALYLKSARRIVDGIGIKASSDREVCKGVLVKAESRFRFYELVARVITAEMRNTNDKIVSYTSETHVAGCKFTKINNVWSPLTMWVRAK